ncbi:hypothetical protein V5799_018547 [Amblyomma americanum]|uniref:Uncharacterized protein n=1 Tax=Amblyomma americanum TaxID=6943 RepID=A0AAQ4F072_AMBAM
MQGKRKSVDRQAVLIDRHTSATEVDKTSERHIGRATKTRLKQLPGPCKFITAEAFMLHSAVLDELARFSSIFGSPLR